MGAGVQHLAAIYSNKEVISPGENLTKAGIRVEMFSPEEKLDPLSRINYAKVYTVEYNVKVFFIGRVHRDHQHRFLADYKNSMGLDYLALREPPSVDENQGYTDRSFVPSAHMSNPHSMSSSQKPGLSRKSSADSIESMVVFSSSSALATSSTTASSFGNEFGGAQRLSDFLFTQEWLQKLSRVALQKVLFNFPLI
jgi:hypothetical protein